ncbi:MAG: hypothetical protein PsegKO_25430 [Pseudohongiellaceae bacterium]
MMTVVDESEILQKTYPLHARLTPGWRVISASDSIELHAGPIVGKDLFSVFDRKKSLSDCPPDLAEQPIPDDEFFLALKTGGFAIRARLLKLDTVDQDSYFLVATPWLAWFVENDIPIEAETIGFSLLDTQSESQISMVVKDSTLKDMEKLTGSLVEQKKVAELANEAKTRFVKHVSHEIRTPLNGIISSVELLLPENDEDKRRKLLRMIDHSARSLNKLISNVLDFSKLEQGVFPSQSQVFSLNDCVTGLVSHHKEEAARFQIDLRLEIDPSVPDWISSNRDAIIQVLDSLVTNALRHSGSKVVELKLAADSVHGRSCVLKMSVSDYGKGIAEQNMDSIFEPFWTEISGQTDSHAMGLGLPIAMNLASSLAGELTVKSAVNQGAVFTFTCPVQLTPTPRAAGTVTEARPQRNPSFQGHILLVDDNQINLELARILFTKLGLGVTTAVNGKQAVEYEQQDDYDLIIMDIAMPVMNGTEAARLIRSRGRNRGVPMLAFTANVSTDDVETYLQSGFNDMLAKPARQDVIIRFCEQFLERG